MKYILNNSKALIFLTFVFFFLAISSRLETQAQAACNIAPSAQLQNFFTSSFNGDTFGNQLRITNNNAIECGAKDFIISRAYPAGWSMNIPNVATVPAQSTTSVALTVTSSSTTASGTYPYEFWVSSMVADGTPTTQTQGIAHIMSASVPMTTPTITNTPTPTPTNTPSPTPTTIPTEVPTNTPSPTNTPIPTNTPTNTPTPTPTPDMTAPLVQFTSPVHMGTVPRNKSVTMTATATDNVGVTQVKFYVDNVLKCTDLVAPYTCAFTTSVKKNITYILEAEGYDAANNIGSRTIQVKTQ